MTTTADIVVAGAGHNSLITAAYLAKAGYECLILDAGEIAGGATATQELLVPGFAFDVCSTGHTLIQPNPVLRDDELGLKREYGLEYIHPDPVAHVVFPDGESFTHWFDLDRTYDEIARFSKRDAETYRRLLAEYAEIRDAVNRYRFNPVGYAPALDEAAAGVPSGAKWLRRFNQSAWDVIGYDYEDRHIQAYLIWQAFQTAQPVDSAGSGLLGVSITAGRQMQSWALPKGGSGMLPLALTRLLADHGASIVTGKRVVQLLVENGRCAGVETADGERYLARHAVVSTIHVKALVEMAPRELWGEGFLHGIDTYDVGLSFAAQYYATTEPPEFVAHEGTQTVASSGVVGWPEDVIQAGRDVRQGKAQIGTWLLVGTPSVADPTRVPGGGHTIKLLSHQPWAPAGDPANWETFNDELEHELFAVLQRAAPNLTEDKVLARKAKSPLELERANPHLWHGAVHGGDRGVAYEGRLRPAPGWAQHRMPIPGLYQTGATTHPGGSVTGGPGRNAAIVLLQDLGHDPATVMRGAGREAQRA